MTRCDGAEDRPAASAGYDRTLVAPIESRPYARDDFPRLAELLLVGRAAGAVEPYPSVGELRLLLADADAIRARVWPDERDGLVAFGLFDPTWRALTFLAAPGTAPADLVPSVLAWAEETARAHPPTEGKPLLRVRPRDTDRGLLGLLEGRGFVDLSPEEAAVVGPLVRRATRAMTAVLAPARVYVCLFAEAAAAAHVHFHLIPRFAATPRELRGPRVFDLLREAMAQGRSLVDVAEAEPVAGAIRDRMRDEA